VSIGPFRIGIERVDRAWLMVGVALRRDEVHVVLALWVFYVEWGQS
jgi:hypothetical protein